jgi:8-oxo-dGTP diphosphatase
VRTPRDRAVSVAIDDGQVLVIRRHKNGRDYCVLPGGGVEAGEGEEQAAVRELAEETGLTGVVRRRLWTLRHDDRVAQYFLVAVEPAPMVLGGPEVLHRTEHNRYLPTWISLRDLDAENLQPEPLRALLRQLSGEPLC